MSESEETIDYDDYDTDTSYMETGEETTKLRTDGKYKSKLKKEK